MTCEDGDERTDESVVQRWARRIAALVASEPIRALARMLPRDVRQAIALVLLTAARVFRT